jgi:rhomboid-like protein
LTSIFQALPSLRSQCPSDGQRRHFTQSNPYGFRRSSAVQILKQYGSGKKPEKGLRFQEGELSDEEVIAIFGSRAPPTNLGNYLLRVIHGRRHDGTLDLPLPEELEEELAKNPDAFEDGLQWLRTTYPIDEDAAILGRIEREEHALERDNPSELLQRGQDLGFYRGPQSGHYQAKLSGKEGDVFGVIVLYIFGLYYEV